MKTGYK